MADRVAVLGLDALPYHMLPTLVEQGLAPNIISESSLKSAIRLEAIPPITPASWPSIMSGVNPGKHGLFSFFHWDRVKKKSVLVHAMMLEHPRIHEMLSYEGVESLVVNPIPDYPLLPARKARILSNLFFVPQPVSRPGGLHEKYFGGIRWPPARTPEYYEDYLEKLLSMIEDVARDPPPLIWINVNFPDAIFHHYPETIKNPQRIGKLWSLVDRIAHVLRQSTGNLLVVSDHGFRIYRARVNINDILYNNGFVIPAESETERSLVEAHAEEKGLATRRIVVPGWVYSLIGRLGLEPIARKLFYGVVQRLYLRITGKTLVVRAGMAVDYYRSKAYMPFGGAYGVFVDDPGLLEDVFQTLSNIKEIKVYRREDVYQGPHASRGPDIVVLGDNEGGYDLGPARIMGTIYTYTRYPNHDLWGVLIPHVEDDSVEWDKLLPEAPNRVVAPIVQCMLGTPVSHLIDDKRVVENACRRKIKYSNYIGKFNLSKRILLSKAKTARKQ